MRGKELAPAVRGPAVLSPIPSEGESKPWAITQQHGKMVSRQDTSRTDQPKPKPDFKFKKKQSDSKKPTDGRITLPVLGSLSMKIETHNPFDSDKKANHEMLYRNKLLRTKKQKSLQGMFQAAKANKELSQILLNINPSFNLDIGEHDLHRFLAPSRHIPPPKDEDEQSEYEPEEEEEEVVEETIIEDVIEEAVVTTTPPPVLPAIQAKPTVPPPLTANELIRRSKVIEAVTPSTFWMPFKSREGESIEA